jgi:pilus assembly protein CpaE
VGEAPSTEAGEPAVPFGQSASAPLRPAGCVPKTAPAATDEFACPPGSAVAVLREHGVEVEPVVYCPVVEMPQMECEVAGQNDAVPTLCFASARGGVGKSALAAMAALSLAREGLAVALIDLDYQFGTCLGYLGAEETDGLFDVGTHPETVRVDARSLARCRTTPERCLAAFEFCRSPEQSEVLVGLTERLVRAARTGADVAIIDLPSGMNEACAQALELSDRCLLVCDQRAFSVESLTALRSLCERMGVARTKLVTVLNRCDARHRDESYLARVQFSVQTPQVVKVVDGGAEVTQLLSIGSAGELVSMRNRFALSAGDLARSVCVDMGCLRTDDVRVHGWGRRGQPADGRPDEKKAGRRGRKEEPCPF